MPDNKKKEAVTKKKTTAKNNSVSTKKKISSSSKNINKVEKTVSQKSTVKNSDTKKTVSKPKSEKTTSKTSKTKGTVNNKKTKAVNSGVKNQSIKKTSNGSKKKEQPIKEVKKNTVVSTKKEKTKPKTIKIKFDFGVIKNKLTIKKDKIKKSDKPKNKGSKSFLVNFKNKLVTKKDSIKKTDKKKIKNKEDKVSPIFTKTTKKWLIIVAIICALIIILEVAYLVYRQIEIDRNTVYYDSLNSLVIDDTDIVAVGSSHFRYSKKYSYTNGYEKAKLIKYDKNGKIIFERMYKNGINTTFSSVISVSDGYIVVGSGQFSKDEQQNEEREAFIIKYDKDGNIIWEKFYQVVTNTRFNKVIATNDGYIAIGQSIYANMEMGNHTTGGGIIVKYNFDGTEVWRNNHGGMKSGNFNDIVEVNGDFYVVGKDATDSANIVKFDANGQYKWHKNYSYTDGIGFTGIAYLDNALYVVGSKKILPEGTTDKDTRNTTNTDALLVKYDLDGKIIFEKNFGGSNYERYNSLLAYRNNLYVVGHTTSKDAGLKIQTDGKLMTGILVRYDKNGNILKKYSYGGSNNDNLTDIVTDSASIYITAYSNSKDGNITTAKNNGKDYFGKVIKLDFKFRTLMVK